MHKVKVLRSPCSFPFVVGAESTRELFCSVSAWHRRADKKRKAASPFDLLFDLSSLYLFPSTFILSHPYQHQLCQPVPFSCVSCWSKDDAGRSRCFSHPAIAATGNLARKPSDHSRLQLLVALDMTGTQYLQVPKFVPHKKGRSRSKSRSHEVIAVESVQVFPSKECPRSPPISAPPSPQLSVRTLEKPQHIPPHAYRWTPPQIETQEIRLDQPNGHVTAEPTSPKVEDLNGEMYTLNDNSTTTLPPPEPTLRERIIGAWKLESYVAHPTPESTIKRDTYPMTKNVTGFIMYTPDGYMSAQMLIPGQQSFKRGEGEEPQWAEAGKRCFAYCGPYYISDEGPGREEVLRHTFQVCNLPGWIGDVQVRTHRFEEDGQVLVLGSEEPTEIKVSNFSVVRMFKLTCCRATKDDQFSNGDVHEIMPLAHRHLQHQQSRSVDRVSNDCHHFL